MAVDSPNAEVVETLKMKSQLDSLRRQLDQKDVLEVTDPYEDEPSKSVSPIIPSRAVDESYKTAQYWSLPENVRNAIDIAKVKSKHSEFFYKL